MSFIQAVIAANKEIHTLLQEGLDESHHLSFSRGAGGDISVGIDLLAERIFIKHLLRFGMIISEESGDIQSDNTSVKIVLDPIDGSDNLLSHLPYYGTSVAYFEHDKCIKAIICNLANGDLFIKENGSLVRGKLYEEHVMPVQKNPYAKVGIFERSYCSSIVHERLKKEGLKYRSPGAFALSLAYAHDVAFVIYEGKMRTYDIEAGIFMCEDLHTYLHEEIFLVSKDKEIFDKIKSLFISN